MDIKLTVEEAEQWLYEPKLFVSPANAKLGGIPSFSILPADVRLVIDNGQIEHVRSSCGDCANLCRNDCYACKLMRLRPTVARSWAQNTLLYRDKRGRFNRQITSWLALHEPRVFRWFVAGDFCGERDLCEVASIAVDNPRTSFYAYTKRVDVLVWYARYCGELPSNLTILYSRWSMEEVNPTGAPEFIVDRGGDPAISTLWHCPAVLPNGRHARDVAGNPITCMQCKRCIHAEQGDKIAVYKH